MSDENTVRSLIYEKFVEDCISLFQHYQCAATFLDDGAASGSASIISVIDAGCDELELSLRLHVPFPVLALSYPCQDMIMDIPEEALEDWLLELANQLMGKIKNRLVSQDLYLKMGLPEAFFDVSVNDFGDLARTHHRMCFEIDHHQVECWMQVDVKQPSLVLRPELLEPVAQGGEIELF